jgi:hypothetical protein
MALNQDIENFIDVLHAIKYQRYMGGSGLETQQRTDELIASLVAGNRSSTGGMPTVFKEIAERILQAEANWDRESGKTYCGQMPSPV